MHVLKMDLKGLYFGRIFPPKKIILKIPELEAILSFSNFFILLVSNINTSQAPGYPVFKVLNFNS
jgi:hypothetical protein